LAGILQQPLSHAFSLREKRAARAGFFRLNLLFVNYVTAR
jgi:hypothetical protein